MEIIFHDFKGIVGSEALNPKLINVAKHFHLLNDFDFANNNKKKKKTGFSGCKNEFYQRLKVEDNTIRLGHDFWAVRFGLTVGLWP